MTQTRAILEAAQRLIFFILITLFFSCNSIENPNSITVASAASTQYVLKALIEAFEAENNLKVKTILGSSGKLTTQVENGAPFDLFISADTQYPNYLFEKQLILEKPVVYAKGTLVLWSYKDIKLSDKLQFLLEPHIHKIAIADPNMAPYGALTKKILEERNLYQKLRAKIVFGESISQVNQYVTTQSVDCGLTAKAVIMAPNLKNKGKYLEIPNYSLDQSMVLLQAKGKPFFEFIQSTKGKQILKNYGYDLE